VIRGDGSGLAAGKAHRRGTGAVVGLGVNEADHAFLDLAPGALQGRADVLGLFDIFGSAAQGLGHLVVAQRGTRRRGPAKGPFRPLPVRRADLLAGRSAGRERQEQ
jgi:hypothetical protein